MKMLKKVSMKDIVPFIFILIAFLYLIKSVDVLEIISNFMNFLKELNGKREAFHIAVAFFGFNLAYIFWYLKKKFLSLGANGVFLKIISASIYSFGMTFLIVLLFKNSDDIEDLAAIIGILGLVTIYINGKREFDTFILNKLNVDPFKK